MFSMQQTKVLNISIIGLCLSLSTFSQSSPFSSQLLQADDCEDFLENQLIFERLAFDAVKKSKIGEKSFDEINAEFGVVRRLVQDKQKKPIQKGNGSHFGSLRTGGLATPFSFESGPYHGGFRRIASQMNEVDKSGGQAAGLTAIPEADGVATKFYAFIKADPTDSRGMLVLTSFERVSPTFVRVMHTTPDYLAKVMDIVREKYQIALAKGKSKQETIRAIGEFHWWFVHATPFIRGSASIGEMHAASLFKYHQLQGISLNNFLSFHTRQGLYLDVWALTTSEPREFARYYEAALKNQYSVIIPPYVLPE